MDLSGKKLDLVLILVWPIAASFISFAIGAGMLLSMLLFLAAPSIYLSIRYSKFIKKAALFSFVLSVPVGIIVDHIMEQTGGWLTYSVFGNFRLFNYVIVDQIFWVFFYFYFVAIFYEVFLDQDEKIRLYHPKFKLLACFVVALMGIFILLHFFSPASLNINHFYLKLGLLAALLPVTLGIFRMSRVYGKVFAAAFYFFFLSLIYELTALSLGQWSFPDENQFIGFVELLGLRFPLEEFIFWIILGASATLVLYEFFSDDRK